jgi:DNA polymerase-1
MTGALLTRDPEDLKIYTDGYDPHCVRALAYFPERLKEHIKKLKAAENATEFYYDESKEGLDKWICN